MNNEEIKILAKEILNDEGFKKQLKSAIVHVVEKSYLKDITDELNKEKGIIRDKLQKQFANQILDVQEKMSIKIQNFITSKNDEFNKKIEETGNSNWLIDMFLKQLKENYFYKFSQQKISFTLGDLLNENE